MQHGGRASRRAGRAPGGPCQGRRRCAGLHAAARRPCAVCSRHGGRRADGPGAGTPCGRGGSCYPARCVWVGCLLLCLCLCLCLWPAEAAPGPRGSVHMACAAKQQRHVGLPRPGQQACSRHPVVQRPRAGPPPTARASGMPPGAGPRSKLRCTLQPQAALSRVLHRCHHFPLPKTHPQAKDRTSYVLLTPLTSTSCASWARSWRQARTPAGSCCCSATA